MPEPTAAPASPRGDSSPPPTHTAPRPARPVGRFRLVRNGLIGLACVVILVLGAFSFEGLSNLKESPPRTNPEEDVFQVQVYEAESADVRRIISAFGTARSDRVVVVSAEVSGRIVEVDRLKVGRPVVGDHVQITADGRSERVEGDVLAQIDPRVYQQRLIRIEVQLRHLGDTEQGQHRRNVRLLRQQQDRLETITEEYNSKKKLVDQGAGSATELRRVELDMRQYEEGVIRLETDVELYDENRAQLESDLELARLDLEKTTVRPPFSGIIAQVMAEEGQYVLLGEPLFRITNNDLLEIAVAVSLADAAEIAAELAEGRFPEAALARSETANARWFGNVLRIAPVADELTRTVDVFIEVRNDEQEVPLRPGTFLHARIEGAVMRDAVLIPRDAIIDGSVFVVADTETMNSVDPPQHARRRDIIVERTVQSLALVKDGIRPGDQIVLTNLDVMDEGTLLRAGVVRNLDDELARHQPAYVHRVDGEDPEGPAGSGS